MRTEIYSVIGKFNTHKLSKYSNNTYWCSRRKRCNKTRNRFRYWNWRKKRKFIIIRYIHKAQNKKGTSTYKTNNWGKIL